MNLIFSFVFTTIFVAKVGEIIHPPTAEYIMKAIKMAEEKEGECLIIELDTPGGLDEAMRDITKGILNAKIPIIVYVYPSGARCASAGVFILLSAHIAAMALGTNVGAATPVAIGGEIPKEMKEKVLNDAIAYIKSIAEKRKRNVEWAVKAVKEAVSVSAEEAKKMNIIDCVAENLEELIEKIDGKKVEIDGKEKILETKGKEIKEIEWKFRERFLSKIAHPNLAYILLMIGIWGIMFELMHPGAIFPGVIGGISLLLAFYSFRILPINYAAIGLIILGCILFILEALTPTYGPLTIGGIISLTLGSLMLVRVKVPFLQISKISVIIVVAATAAFFIFAFGMAIKAMRKKPATGSAGLIGEIGIVKERIEPDKPGKVFIEGEWWNAEADEIIEVNEKVKVVNVERLVLKVVKYKRG